MKNTHRLELRSGLKRLFFLVFLFSSILIFRISASYTHELVKTEEKTFDLISGSSLEITVSVGNIEISTWNLDKIFVRFRKWTDAGSQHKAQKLMEKLQVEFIQQKDVFEIRQLKQGSGNPFSNLLKKAGLQKSSSSRIDFILRVPRRLKLKINLEAGKIIIDSLAGIFDLKQKKGELQLNSLMVDKIDLDLDDVHANIVNLKGEVSSKANVVVSIDKGNLIFQECLMGKMVVRLKDSNCFLAGNSITNCDIESKTGDVFFVRWIMKKVRIKSKVKKVTSFFLFQNRHYVRLYWKPAWV